MFSIFTLFLALFASSEAMNHCKLCKIAMYELDNMLVNPVSEELVKKALDMLCDKFPGSLGSACESLVSSYYDIIVEKIVKEHMQPDQVCDVIKVCP